MTIEQALKPIIMYSIDILKINEAGLHCEIQSMVNRAEKKTSELGAVYFETVEMFSGEFEKYSAAIREAKSIIEKRIEDQEITQAQIFAFIYPEIMEEAEGWAQGYSTGRDGTTHELSLADLKEKSKSLLQVLMWPDQSDPEKFHEIAKTIEKARFNVEELILLALIEALRKRFGAAKAIEFMIMESL